MALAECRSKTVAWWNRIHRVWQTWRAWRFELEPIYRHYGSRLIRKLYHPTFIGFDQLPASGPGIVISNHVSYMDGLILSTGSPRPLRYVIDEEIYRLPVVHHFMRVNRAIPVLATRDSVSAMIEAVGQALREGDLVCIFPEGQLTYTGSLSRFKPGIEWIMAETDAPVYPVAIKGLWGSVFSRKRLGRWNRWWPRKGVENVVAICGDPIPAGDVTANRLQQEVLKLKYRIRAD